MAAAAAPSNAIVSSGAAHDAPDLSGFAWYTICPSKPLAKKPDNSPAADPTASSTMGRPHCGSNHPVLSGAPNAARMPSSFKRRLTL